jgi:hypothetical protein
VVFYWLIGLLLLVVDGIMEFVWTVVPLAFVDINSFSASPLACRLPYDYLQYNCFFLIIYSNYLQVAKVNCRLPYLTCVCAVPVFSITGGCWMLAIAALSIPSIPSTAFFFSSGK